MKKALCILMSLVLLASFTGCEDARNKFYGDSEPKTDNAAPSTDENDITKNYDLAVPDYSKYYKLGQHSGLEYYINDADYEVNDDTVTSMILSELGIEPTTTDKPAVEGNYVNISIHGTVNGEEFDGGTVNNSDIILGRHSILPEVEDAIIDMSAGETKTIDYTFDNDYKDTSLVGKTAQFEITLNSVKVYDDSLLTDELVAEKTDYETVTDYKKSVHDSIAKDLEDLKRTDSAATLMSLILANSEIIGYDTAQVDDMIESAKYMTRTYAKQQDMEVDDYCKEHYNKTYDEYVEGLKDTAHEYLDSVMTICQIAREEGIEVTDEEYQNQIKTYMDNYNLSEADISKTYTSQDIVNSILILKVQDWLLEHNTKTDKKPTAPTNEQPD